MKRRAVTPTRERRTIRGSVEHGKVNAEYTTANGETITLKPHDVLSGYEIACWKENGECRWTRFHGCLEDAIHEFKHWM